MSTDMGHTDGVFGNGTWGTFNVVRLSSLPFLGPLNQVDSG